MWCICKCVGLNGAPKSMGRKGNGRKRGNKKRADIEEVVNIFDENEIENPSFYSLFPNNTNRQNEKAINEKTYKFPYFRPNGFSRV